MAAEVSVIATLISAIAFVAHWPNGTVLPNWLTWFIGTPLLLGTVPTLILWLLLAFIMRRSTAVDRMNISSYGELISHLSVLDAQLSSLALESKEMSEEHIGMGTNVYLSRSLITNVDIKEVLEYRDAICKKLETRSQGWVTAIGYIDLWKAMHNAEVALINVMPLEAVIAEAVADELRIQDSNISASTELIRKLRLAVQVLDSKAVIYLQPLSPNLPGEAESANVVTDDMKTQARAILCEVRQTLNDFRDDRWQAIVHMRNQFVSTTIFTGIAMYVLLQFAILAGAPRPTILSATAFYLVGALVGLFGRLLSESQTSNAVDDYRLAMIRLAALPLYCGLAAVGGVLFVQNFTFPASIFDPKNFLSNLFIAAGFGLTPNLLVDRLQKRVEQDKNDLSSTNAAIAQKLKNP
jgi:hypothetical protein